MTKFLRIYMDYDRDQGLLQISNCPLLDATLSRFGLTDANAVATSVGSGVRFEQEESGEEFNGPNAQLMGALIYLVSTGRPDISFAVGSWIGASLTQRCRTLLPPILYCGTSREPEDMGPSTAHTLRQICSVTLTPNSRDIT